MDKYLNYSSIEFVHDDDFLNWVNHGRHHVLTDRRWRAWIEDNPQKSDDIEQARVLVLTLAQEPTVVASQFVREQLWSRIQGTLRDNDAPIEHPSLISRWYSKAAVAIGVLVFIVIVVYRQPGQVADVKVAEVETGSPNTILVKATRESHTLVLSDGSSIVLMPGSILEYPRDFSDSRREVYLSGEAYFEVSDDTHQPFVVKTSQLTMAALGTSFNVRSYENEDDTRIQVKAGRASLTQNDASSSSSIVLMSNHQAIFRHADKKMIRSLVDDPGILVPLAQADFLFRDTPIKTVIESIENAYGIDITFNELRFSGCALDADLNKLTLYGKLKTICDKVACSYEVVDARIVMHGGGCGDDFAQAVTGL